MGTGTHFPILGILTKSLLSGTFQFKKSYEEVSYAHDIT